MPDRPRPAARSASRAPAAMLLALALAAPLARGQGDGDGDRDGDGDDPKESPEDAPRWSTPGAALERGCALLLASQESLEPGAAEDAPRAEWPYEGVYRERGRIPIGYRVGGTAIGAWALVETEQHAASGDLRAAVERALGFVLAALERDDMGIGFSAGYDVRGWGHAYALHLLLRLRAKELVPAERAQEVDAKVAWLVRALVDTALPRGGWNYSRGGGGSASPFMTAPTLLALYEARAQGADVDVAAVEAALDALESARTEEGGMAYTARGGMDELPATIGRTPAGEVALLLAGRSDPARVRAALDAFFEHWEQLEARRRRHGTHEGPYGIAPYYFFHAHWHAALAIEHLPADARPQYRARLRERLFAVQEPSGGWNDRVFPRSESFGTAMSMLALRAPELDLPSAWPTKSEPAPR